MTYEPPFYAYEPFLLGVGVVFNLLTLIDKMLPFRRIAWEKKEKGPKTQKISTSDGGGGLNLAVVLAQDPRSTRTDGENLGIMSLLVHRGQHSNQNPTKEGQKMS